MKYPHEVVKDDLFGLFESSQNMVKDFWNLLDHPGFPFVTLTSTTNGARNFPPYDIIELPEGKVRLELAAAGYTKDQLTVQREGNVLIIKGAPKPDSMSITDGVVETYRHKGISSAAWLRTFDLQPNVTIDSVQYENGILRVVVSSVQPEKKSRTTFEIK